MREQGLAHPVVIILLFVLSAGLIIIFSYTSNSAEPKVKGISDTVTTAGFSVFISSSDKWDFVEYLCSDLDQCAKKSTISGGAATSHELVVMRDPSWDSVNYVKVFTKPSWGTRARKYNLNVVNSIAKSTTIEDDTGAYNALILPTDALTGTFIENVATFSD